MNWCIIIFCSPAQTAGVKIEAKQMRNVMERDRISPLESYA